MAWVDSGRAEVALRRHEWAGAGELLVDALDVFVANGDQPRTAHCVTLLAELAAARGLDGQAERLEAGLRRPGSLPALARSDAEAASAPDSPLTPRQREVATLVARGATNRQIAAQLQTSSSLPSTSYVVSWIVVITFPSPGSGAVRLGLFQVYGPADATDSWGNPLGHVSSPGRCVRRGRPPGPGSGLRAGA